MVHLKTEFDCDPRQPLDAPGASDERPRSQSGHPLLDGAVEAARHGDEDALTALYREFHPGLVRYLTAHAGSEAEDLASEVWLGVASQLDHLEKNVDAFRGLLYTIARRRAIDHHRKRFRRKTEPAAPSTITATRDQRDLDTSLDDRIVGDDVVREIVAMLPPAQADVVLLRVVAGLSTPEVAAIVGRSPGAVSVLQHRALRRLAELLGERGSRRTGDL